MVVYASLIIGVEVDYRESKTSVTRYNERTGKPYQIEETEEGQYFLKGTDVLVDVLDYGEEEDEEGLVGIPMYEESEDPNALAFVEGGIVGLVISQLSEDISTEVKEIPYTSVVNAIALASRLLGERYKYHGEVKVFLTKEMSY